MSAGEEQLGSNEIVRRALRARVLTLECFETARQRLDSDLDASLKRDWVMRAIQDKDEIHRWWRLRSKPEEIEEEVFSMLSAFEEIKPASYRESALRLMRRFLLSRYSFVRVCRLDLRILMELGAKPQPWWNWKLLLSKMWMGKDYILPRVGLSLPVGYAAILGAGGTAERLTRVADCTTILFWLLVTLESILAWLLVYLSVRGRIGAASARALIKRTAGVFGGCLAWAGAGSGVQYWLGPVVGECSSAADSILKGITALVLAILGQFFFSKNHISEPL